MARELSVVDLAREVSGSTNGRLGAAHGDPRDAYKDVPILHQPTWKHEIAGYFYFGGLSSGAFAIGALADLFGGKRQRGLARTAHAVAFLTMAPCAPLLIADLGKPGRFHHMLRIFKPSSPMNLGAWTLTAHGGFSTLLALRLLAEHGKLPLLGDLLEAIPAPLLSAAGMPTALTLGTYTGVLLGTNAIPVWATSPLLAALFMVSSLSTGSAAVSLASTITGRDSEVAHEALSPLTIAVGSTELATTAAYIVTSGPAAKHLVTGKAAMLIRGATILTAAGIVLEVVSSKSPGNRKLLSGLAAAATLAGGALLRWGIVNAGHESGRDREGQLKAASPSPQAPGWGPGGR